MLKIDRVDQSSTRTYHFPTIDFKFQNTGKATAFLWKFVIEVLHAEIDPTPVLDFDMEAKNGVLHVLANNNGWGTAYSCQVRISENTLNQLYATSMLQYTGVIQSGEQKIILSFEHVLAHREQFIKISENFVDRSPHQTIRGTRIETANIVWKCKDNKNVQHSGSMNIPSRGFFLTERGFYIFYDNLMAIMGNQDSDITYSTIIDLSKGTHEQAYPISRKVSSGDVERFHIMVGAPMSCHLSIRFKFFIDQATMVESEVFDVKIWNPRNSQWHSNYKDGETLNRMLYERRNRKTQQVIKDDIYDLDKPRGLQLFTHYEEAFAAYEAERLYNQGLALHDLKQYDAALTAYNQAIQLNPNQANIYFCKGVVLYTIKHYNEAILAYETAVKLGLNSHDLVVRQFSRYEQVLTAELAIHRHPDDAGAYANKGNVLFNLKEYEEALVAYEQAIQVDNDDASTYTYKGNVLMKLQRYEEALVAHEQAIRLKPNHADAFYKKGHALKRLGKLEEAQLAYERARQLKNN